MAELLLTFASVYASGANPGVLLITGISAIHGVVIFGLSLWRGMGGGKNWLDWACFAIEILGLIVWQLSGQALAGLALAIFADFMAYVPAYVKTWKHPETESPWFYLYYILGALLGLMAYRPEAASAFQVYVIICCLIMIGCIYRRQIKTKLFGVLITS